MAFSYLSRLSSSLVEKGKNIITESHDTDDGDSENKNPNSNINDENLLYDQNIALKSFTDSANYFYNKVVTNPSSSLEAVLPPPQPFLDPRW
jgi:hypothetical protein